MVRMGSCVAALLVGALLGPAGALAAAGQAGPRVVGGAPSSVSKYPWQAAVVISPAKLGGGAQDRLLCGGSLVTPYVVLTAAHCVFDTDPDNPAADIVNDHLDADDVDVVLGRTTLSSTDGTEQTVRAVSFNPGYSESSSQNDAGYLVLDSPSGQQPIKIAGSDEAALWSAGRLTEVSGWGTTSEGSDSISDRLRAATTPVIADSSCGSSGVYGGLFDPATMVCAGYLAGRVDTCYGDSGGPLQAPTKAGGYRLVGVTSWGDGCARAFAPGVYARVAGNALRASVSSQVSALESTYGLPHQGIVGTGAKPPASKAGKNPGGQQEVGGKQRARARCKRIKNESKRRRCFRRHPA